MEHALGAGACLRGVVHRGDRPGQAAGPLVNVRGQRPAAARQDAQQDDVRVRQRCAQQRQGVPHPGEPRRVYSSPIWGRCSQVEENADNPALLPMRLNMREALAQSQVGFRSPWPMHRGQSCSDEDNQGRTRGKPGGTSNALLCCQPPGMRTRSQVPTQRARPRGRHRDPRRLRRDSGCRMGLPGSAARRRPQSVSALWESPGRSYAENADPRPARPCRDERAALAQTQEAGEGARRLVMPGTAARSSASQREQASRKPRSLVPIMTTAASGRLRRGSSPLRSCHHRLAVWSPAEGKPLNKDTRTQGD